MNDSHLPPHPMKLMGRAMRGFSRIADTALRDLGFATGQLPVLVSLKHRQALSQAELARIAEVEQPSMAQLLNRMERDGLVQRVADPADKRSRLISLTADAGQRMPQAKAVMEAMTEKALAGFTPEEVAQFTRLVLRLNDNIDRMGDPSGSA
jgi:MarR family transcriptional regulator for hemolysin